MRVLFTTYSQKTHFLAMAPLAWALRTAGHEVCFAVQPKFADVVTQAGLTAVPVGGDRDLWQIMNRNLTWLYAGENGLPIPYDTAEWAPEDVTWDHLWYGYDVQIKRWHKVSNVPIITDVVEFARQWQPDLVIWEPVTYAGALAAKACGAAHARLLFSLDTFGVTRAHFHRVVNALPPDERHDPFAEWLEPYARKYGFEFSEELITGQFTIGLLPPALRLEAELNYLPMRYLPYGGPAVVPKWLWEDPGRPRVALTMGLSATDTDVGYAISVQDILDVLADLDIELVATVSEQEQAKLARIPDNARLVPFVPLPALAPTCAAVIHHAGFGTLATVASYAVPQLAVARDSDGPALARRVEAHGAGLALDATSTSAKEIRECLLRLLSEPSFQAGADRLRDEILAMPTPNELVRQLEDRTASHRAATQ
ncbi:activator-dependent family glycosyltransferase [Actinoplanes sp. NEAU-A12]|uniref:Activator-dependent family glycosyltransferase n=1 Tax=Actinoplanes sandaracinus TaxID=3045177 RepID=A0ABT6WZI3_9ACTN|nr:activator-dependent family glycosyltransferase [Actinoplanes sandaracinus]MDI6105165.1 activator-dependent family glycosyltransferase [Actinoplanes sandaracinus]